MHTTDVGCVCGMFIQHFSEFAYSFLVLQSNELAWTAPFRDFRGTVIDLVLYLCGNKILTSVAYCSQIKILTTVLFVLFKI